MKTDIGREFMEKTKFQYAIESDQMKGLPQPPLELIYEETAEVIDLPSQKNIDIPPVTLRNAIENRQSCRSYSDKPLTLEELSFMLWCTQGVKEIIPVPPVIEFPEPGQQGPGKPRPEDQYRHVLGGQGNPGNLPRVERVGHGAAALPDPVHKPGSVKGGDIRAAAGADDHFRRLTAVGTKSYGV